MSRGGDRTNAMRILDARGAAYEALSFPCLLYTSDAADEL